MADIIKLVGTEITLNATANLVGSATVVKIINSNTSSVSLLTVVPSSGSNTTTSILPQAMIYLQKASDSKITSSLTSGVLATPIAFT